MKLSCIRQVISPLEGALTKERVMDEELKKLWADQDAMPDVNNEEPQSSFDIEGFEIYPVPVHVLLRNMVEDWRAISLFLESGGFIRESIHPQLPVSFFIAHRKTNINGVGKTPTRAIANWALKTRLREHS